MTQRRQGVSTSPAGAQLGEILVAQVAGEVGACLDFVAAMYRLFGFSFRAKLSTRPPAHVTPCHVQMEAAVRHARAFFHPL